MKSLNNKKIECNKKNTFLGDKPGEISYIPSTTFITFLYTVED
jgi:hypothetical protein